MRVRVDYAHEGDPAMPGGLVLFAMELGVAVTFEPDPDPSFWPHVTLHGTEHEVCQLLNFLGYLPDDGGVEHLADDPTVST